jgi:hypothetical protein
MLSQMAERAGYPVICLPVSDSVSMTLDQLAGIVPQPGDVLCVCALPPFALLKARSLSKQVHLRFPELKILVGLWNFSDAAGAKERFGKAFSHTVVTTVADALAEIRAFAEPEPAEGVAQLETANVTSGSSQSM